MDAQRSSQMVMALCPIETLPRETVFGWFEGINIKPDGREPFDALGRHLKLFAFRRNNEASLLQTTSKGNPDLAGQMVVTAPAETKLSSFGA